MGLGDPGLVDCLVSPDGPSPLPSLGSFAASESEDSLPPVEDWENETSNGFCSRERLARLNGLAEGLMGWPFVSDEEDSGCCWGELGLS